jgi:hypothetical protein
VSWAQVKNSELPINTWPMAKALLPEAKSLSQDVGSAEARLTAGALPMDRICRNREYFVRISTHTDAYSWADCMNPEMAVVDAERQTERVFRWADGTCIYFKPTVGRQEGGPGVGP